MSKRRVRAISVPPELEGEMAMFPKKKWSRVACKAFRDELQELNALKVTDKDKQTIERLRASKASSLKREGKLAGIEYPSRKPDYSPLSRLERWYDQAGSLEDAIGDAGIRDIAKIMVGEDGSEEGIVSDLLSLYGDDIDDPIWIEGFVEGAVGKFKALKDQL